MSDRTTNVLIVGAGPIGIEIAVALKRRGIDYLHLEAKQIGSTIAWYAPGTHFYSSPERISLAGVPLQTLDQTKATREDYLAYLRGVVQQFDLPILTGHRVSSLVRQSDHFDVSIEAPIEDYVLRASSVVLAIGDMHGPRLIDVPGESLPHVSHYFAEPHNYFRRDVVIVGGRNSAVEAAIRCQRVGARVTMVHRGEKFGERVKAWLLPEIEAMIRDGLVDFLSSTRVVEIRPGSVLLDRDGGTFERPADDVLLLTGYQQDAQLFRKAGVAMEGPGRAPQVDPGTMESSVPGLYIAGTAVAGTQLEGAREFIETSHVHVGRIVAAICGESSPEEPASFSVPET